MPRKTFAYAPPLGADELASMRPRPDAAENAERAGLSLGQPLASMRPRPDAAENPAAASDRGPQGTLQ